MSDRELRFSRGTLPEEPAQTPAGASPATFWWNVPKGDVTWLDPPIPLEEGVPGGVRPEELLDALGKELPGQRLSFWLALWKYHTRARAAMGEFLALERDASRQLERLRQAAEQSRPQIEQRIEALRGQREALEREREAARTEFEQAASGAGLACDPVPERVERALYDSVPTLDELAGEHGLGPVTHPGNRVGQLLRELLALPVRWLAPLASGLILALTMGTLTGLLSLVDLQRADRARQLGLAGLLGFVIVYLLGELVGMTFHGLARSLEQRREGYPRLRGTVGMAVFGLVAVGILGAAEVATEALGIRELHRQYLAEAQRLGNTALDVPLMPFGVYLLIGTLISGPYLAYKAVTAWNDSELRHREAWLLHLQKTWVDERRGSASFQAAMARAHRVAGLEQGLGQIDAQLTFLQEQRDRGPELDEATKQRRDRAREAAVAERKLLDLFIEDLIRNREPLPDDPAEQGSPRAAFQKVWSPRRPAPPANTAPAAGHESVPPANGQAVRGDGSAP